MKAWVSRGSGFREVLNYIFDADEKEREDRQAEIIGGNMEGKTLRELSREFVALRRLKPELKRLVWHCSLSLSKGEKLTNEEWNNAVEDFMIKMDFDMEKTMFVVVKKVDIKTESVHIVAQKLVTESDVIQLGSIEA